MVFVLIHDGENDNLVSSAFPFEIQKEKPWERGWARTSVTTATRE